MSVEEKYCCNCKYCEITEGEPCISCKNTSLVDSEDYNNKPFLWEPIDENVSNDPVNRPSHYTDGKIEVIDYIEDKKLGFCLGNAIKYISRAGKKDPSKEIEDLDKAIWYIKRRIKEIQEARL